MVSRVKLIQNIFIFLLLSVGILFISLIIRRSGRSLREGFAIDPNAIRGCELKNFATPSGEVQGLLCGTEVEAQSAATQVIPYGSLTMDGITPTAPICYLKITTGLKDTAQPVFVCYNRPPDLIQDDLGMRYLDPMIDIDQTPETLGSEIPTTCTAYKTAYAQALQTQSTLTGNISFLDNTMGVLSNVYTTLNTTYNTKCKGSLTQAQKNMCGSMSAGIATYNDLLTNSNSNNIINVRQTMTNVNKELTGLINGGIAASFAGLDCADPVTTATAPAK